ncbi:hypothetical protein CspeluHIS016_0402540 [Cutaneotrichosporon spelunceum]|uniref:N-acetyltransferase domain-containing protein n=1 Tax=Cutaneotrichosporon spelunceum TaxID=1672016 RepID=A0AAD3TV37_9TREE|nr:hypothetical protein CspeluHIS016_0402540 [Cutaneotrichosporon spelunceum]
MSALPFHTERLTISPLTAADRDAFVAYRDNPDIARHQGWGIPYTAEDADALLARQPTSFPPPPGTWLQLAIHGPPSLTGIPTLLGDLAVHTVADQPALYEIGITIAAPAQRAGIGAEALAAILDALFACGAHRVIAQSDVHNPAVGGLLRKAGFTLEGTAREADWHKGAWVTVQHWGVLRRDREGEGREGHA